MIPQRYGQVWLYHGGMPLADRLRPHGYKEHVPARENEEHDELNRAENDKYVKEDLQPVFWYCKGITAKPGVGEVLAEHPAETGPDGRSWQQWKNHPKKSKKR